MRRLFSILIVAMVLGLCACDAQSQNQCEKIERFAQKAEGTPYVWGAESLEKGMDCSGFVYWIQMKINRPVPRTTAHKYWLMAKGDKRHWKNATCTDWVWWQFDPRRPYGHIGIMVENPKFWQSGSSSGVCSRKFFEGSFWDNKFKGTKRAAE